MSDQEYRGARRLVKQRPSNAVAFPATHTTPAVARSYAAALSEAEILSATERCWARQIMVMATAPCFYTRLWLSRRFGDLIRSG